MKILVTGGAGYIGSFMVKYLLDNNYQVVVFDNLERGYRDAIDSRAEFIKGDIRNTEDLNSLFKQSIDAVIHFAGLISVEESTREPEIYEDNNVVGSRNLFTTAIKNNVKKIIFSSTAAVYGNPLKIPIPEDHSKNPTSPYGETKLEVENILTDLRKETPDFSFAALRYFNASGAAIDGSMGENHKPETHIIPLAIKAALNSLEFSLFGNDYDTPDGTCIRDYIHVLDLVKAHVLALEKLNKESGGYYYNVGTGNGYSNRQVVEEVERVSGKKINVSEKERRAGDPSRLIADSTKINTELGFSPTHSDLATIVESAYKWYTNKK